MDVKTFVKGAFSRFGHFNSDEEQELLQKGWIKIHHAVLENPNIQKKKREYYTVAEIGVGKNGIPIQQKRKVKKAGH